MQLGLPLQSGSGLSCVMPVLNTWLSAWSFVVWCLPFQVAKYWLLYRATRLIVPHALHYFSSNEPRAVTDFSEILTWSFWAWHLSVHKLKCFKFAMVESCVPCTVLFFSICWFLFVVSICQNQLERIHWESI